MCRGCGAAAARPCSYVEFAVFGAGDEGVPLVLGEDEHRTVRVGAVAQPIRSSTNADLDPAAVALAGR